MNHQGLYWESGRALFRGERAHARRRAGWLVLSAALAAFGAWALHG